MAVKPIPDGYTTVTPYLVVDGAEKLLDFVKQAFGAEELFRMDGPDGTIGHAEVKIGDSIVMLGNSDGSASGKAMPSTIYLYVEDADATYGRAIDAGGASVEEPADQFYGDRRSAVRDPLGNQWFIATHVEDPTPEEMDERMKAFSQQS